ncbi:MAG: carotenoid oxygenase family protein, partial [Solirubrobacterales bacterium]
AFTLMFPLIVDPIDILKTGRPFIENFQYRPARGTKITAIDRETGKVGGEWEADAGFCFHHVNAYEDGEDLVVDLCRFDDASIVEELYIDRLREGGSATIGYLHRYRLTPGRKRADEKRLSDTPLELPRINYAANNGKAYRFAYGVSAADEYSLNVLAKVDVETGDALTWSEGDCAVGEPVFVASPEKRAEDDGVLLSVVLDGSSGRSFLLVLDATNLSEVARAEVSHGIPAGFHGSYVNH